MPYENEKCRKVSSLITINEYLKINNKNLINRNTPTSQGPNSYGKTSLGFCDSRALFEKQLKEQADLLLKEEEKNKLNSNK